MDPTQHDAEGSLILTKTTAAKRGAHRLNSRRCNVIAVHGFADMGKPHASLWCKRQDEGTPTSWLKEFLPLYVQCTRLMTYHYSIPRKTQGISTIDIQSLAKKLLDEILAETDTVSGPVFVHKLNKAQSSNQLMETQDEDFVFFGHDLGGLIIKEALSIARRVEDYINIIGNTSTLVFFETPHRSTPEKSWEALANWLVFASCEQQLFSLSWIQTTAQMMKAVCTNFQNIERLHRVMNVYYQSTSPAYDCEVEPTNWLSLNESSATLGIQNEVNETRDEYHRMIPVFSSNLDPVLERICNEINSSGKPGQALIECLATLASMATRPQDPTLSPTTNCTNSATLQRLAADPEFLRWTTSSNGSLEIIMPSGDDGSTLFSHLRHGQAGEEMRGKSATLSYVFSPCHPEQNQEEPLLASLCSQLLGLNPHLFKHVIALNNSLQAFAEDMAWRARRLFILFRSLLRCPNGGKKICVLLEMDGTRLPERAVENLCWLAATEDSEFRFVAIRNTRGDSGVPAVYLEREGFGLEEILDNELNSLNLRHPGLHTIQSTLRGGLLEKHKDTPRLFTGSYNAVKATIQAWLSLIIRAAEPLSISSVTNAMTSMPTKIEDLYGTILQRIPPHKKKTIKGILSWLAFSQRPLSVAELAAASTLEDNPRTIDDIHRSSWADLAGDLDTVFGSIIYVDDDGYPVLPAELRTLLLDTHGKGTSECDDNCLCSDGELALTQRCLEFLNLYGGEDPDTLAASIDSHPFVGYAIKYWPVHYANGMRTLLQERENRAAALEPLQSSILGFFHDKELMSSWAKAYCLLQQPVIRRPTTSPLAIAAEAGCLDLVKVMLPLLVPRQEEDVTALSCALVAAIVNGDMVMVEVLIGAGADSSFALHTAASSGQRDLIKRLNPSTLSLDTRDRHGLTPLHHACRSGVLGIVEDLLAMHSDVNAKSIPEGTTPLHMACMFGHVDVIECLQRLDDLDLNAKDKNGTPLFYACEWQQADAVNGLLHGSGERKIDVKIATSSHETTALHHAASRGRLDILKPILDYCCPASVDLTDKSGEHSGDEWEDMSEDGVPVDNLDTTEENLEENLLIKEDEFGLTALHLAAREGHLKVSRELLNREVCRGTPSASLRVDMDGNLPIHLAAMEGHAEIVELLLRSSDDGFKQLSRATETEFMTPLHLAVERGHTEVVRLLCKEQRNEKIPLDGFNRDQSSALHLAARNGQLDIVRLLVENGATPDIQDLGGATPLLVACRGDHEAVATFLIEEDAGIDIPDDDEMYPLIAAAKAGNANLVHVLLDTACQRNVTTQSGMTPLLAAAQSGSVPTMELLAGEKADWGARDDEGCGALHLAVRSGNEHAVVFVLKHFQPIDSKDTKNQTALHYAAIFGTIPVFHSLLDKGADPFAEDWNDKMPLELVGSDTLLREFLITTKLRNDNGTDVLGRLSNKLFRHTAYQGYRETLEWLWNQEPRLDEAAIGEQTLVHIAAEQGHSGMVKYLVNQAKLQGDTKDDNGRTPLSFAAEKGHLEVVQFLAQQTSAGITSADSRKNTPLLYAAMEGHKEVVSFLLAHGHSDLDEGDISILNVNNQGPLWAAARNDDKDMVELFLQWGADPNVADAELGYTPLHYAAKAGSLDIIRLLLAADGITGDATNHEGKTPMYLAAYYGQKGAVGELINAGWKSSPPTYSDSWYPLHAAYDRDDILDLLLNETDVSVNAADADGCTALHLATPSYPDSVRVLLEHGADPTLPDNYDTTPLHLGVQYLTDEEVRLMMDRALQNHDASTEAADIRNLKDSEGRSPLLIAASRGKTSMVKSFLEGGHFDAMETDNDGDTVLDIAARDGSPETIAVLLDMADADFKPEILQRVLLQVLERNSSSDPSANKIKTDLIRSLEKKEPGRSWQDDRLFELLMAKEDIILARALWRQGLGKTMAGKRDQHNWTLGQMIQAFEPGLDTYGSEKHKERTSPPSGWDMDRKANCIVAAEPEKDGPILHIRFSESTDFYPGAVLANHPVPYGEKFYFEITIISISEHGLAIGFGIGNIDMDRMPGWDENTWGLHGDDGGLFHAGGSQVKQLDTWKFVPGDIIGVCIDTPTGKASYAKNGQAMDVGFAGLRGRIFPMIGLGLDGEIEANFGTNLSEAPFKHPKARDKICSDEYLFR